MKMQVKKNLDSSYFFSTIFVITSMSYFAGILEIFSDITENAIVSLYKSQSVVY